MAGWLADLVEILAEVQDHAARNGLIERSPKSGIGPVDRFTDLC